MKFTQLTMGRFGWPARVGVATLSCLLLWAAISLSARAADSQTPTKATKTVSLTIDYGDGVEKRFKAIPWQADMTVLEALQFADKHPRGIEYKMRGRGKTAFLISIDDLANRGSRGGNWIFRINGKHGESSFAICGLKPGDAVLWTFGTYP